MSSKKKRVRRSEYIPSANVDFVEALRTMLGLKEHDEYKRSEERFAAGVPHQSDGASPVQS